MLISDLKRSARREASVVFPVVLMCLFYTLWSAFWTPDHWYQLRQVYVQDSVVGSPIFMDVDRKIIRDFEGAYSVKVRSIPSKSTVCSGGSQVTYETDATLPDPLTLEWWTYGARPNCMNNLAVGKYELNTCVTIYPNELLLGPRRICVASNVFEVKKKS